MKENRGLTILCGLIPGAGQMYLGLMKKGLFILLGLALLNIVSDLLNIYLFHPFIPVIWIYSFFDTLHLSKVDHEERQFCERLFIERIEGLLHQDWHAFIDKHRTVITVITVIVGIELFYSNILYPLSRFLPRFISWPFELLHSIQGSLYSFAFIGAAIYFFLRYRDQQDQEKDM